MCKRAHVAAYPPNISPTQNPARNKTAALSAPQEQTQHSPNISQKSEQRTNATLAAEIADNLKASANVREREIAHAAHIPADPPAITLNKSTTSERTPARIKQANAAHEQKAKRKANEDHPIIATSRNLVVEMSGAAEEAERHMRAEMAAQVARFPLEDNPLVYKRTVSRIQRDEAIRHEFERADAVAASLGKPPAANMVREAERRIRAEAAARVAREPPDIDPDVDRRAAIHKLQVRVVRAESRLIQANAAEASVKASSGSPIADARISAEQAEYRIRAEVAARLAHEDLRLAREELWRLQSGQ